MKERPILFSGPMVRASLEGRKTQTRRVVKPQPELWQTSEGERWVGRLRDGSFHDVENDGLGKFRETCPYGAPGDRLWVRETHVYRHKHDRVYYRADHPIYDPYAHNGWRPSIFMPRKWSRLTLEVTGVRVERLQDISEEDVRAEGMGSATACSLLPHGHGNGQDLRAIGCGDIYEAKPNTNDWTPRDCWRIGWCSINGADSWAANPWVWVVEFKRIAQEARAA